MTLDQAIGTGMVVAGLLAVVTMIVGLAVNLLDYWLLGIWNGLKNVFHLMGHRIVTRPQQRASFDLASARRESHALGLPFPESDGTLSFPKPTPEQVHAQPPGIRMLAQFGISGKNIAPAGPISPPPINAFLPRSQREGWAALVRENGWSCSIHESCELDTAGCRIVVRRKRTHGT